MTNIGPEDNLPSETDKILSRIVELEKNQTKRKANYEKIIVEINTLNKQQKDVQAAFDIVKQQLTDIANKNDEAKSNRDRLVFEGQQDKSEIERLKRELNRLKDLELNQEAYRAEIEKLKERCLNSSWRKENRNDGDGALTHQIEGAIHLAVVKQGLLGDKRGLGKTLTNLIWLDLLEAKKVIVICPSDTMNNYIREIIKWTPHRKTVKLGGLDRTTRDILIDTLRTMPTFCLVINYEAWRRDEQLIDNLISLKADTLVEDEAHRAKTLSTATCKGVTRLRFGTNQCSVCGSDDITVDINRTNNMPKFASNKHTCNTCGISGIITDFCSIKNVMPMTGTPILNKPQELFPHLRMIDVENFHSESNFLRDFCYQGYNGHWTWGYNAEKRLMKQVGSKFLVRDRNSAGVTIPPMKPVEHLISLQEMREFYPEQFKAYNDVKEAATLIFDPEKEYAMSLPYVIVQIMRLRQILVWPAAINLEIKDPKTDSVLYTAKLDIHSSIKVDKAEEIIKEAVEEDERVVLFSQFKAPLYELEKRLGNSAVVYDGSTPEYKRDEIQLDFDVKTAPKNPRWSVALCNYKAAGEGLNLNAASRMVILDEEWNPGRQEQAYGRIDRLGQKRDTQVDTIRVEKSIDTWMQNLITEKRGIVEDFETEASVMKSFYDGLRNGDI